MKVDDVAPKDADVSPINRSISILPDDGKASTSHGKAKKSEFPFELRPNFSRVTPAQLAYISFPPEGRYQPVRLVTNAPPKTGKTSFISGSKSAAGISLGLERFGGGGGILIFSDKQPNEQGSYIEFEAPAVQPPVAAPEPASGGNGHAIGAEPSGPHIALDENAPEADPPGSFEVCLYFSGGYRTLTLCILIVPF